MRLIDAEELKHKINTSKYYGTEAWCDILDMIADCETQTAVPRIAFEAIGKDYKDMKLKYEALKIQYEYYKRVVEIQESENGKDT